MCINGHHNRLGDSEASAGMAWMSPKRRGRAQRRVSGKTQLVRGQLNFGLCPAPRPNCQRKNCCSGRPDHPRGHPNSFCGGAHHVGCVKGRRLSSTCEDSGETLALEASRASSGYRRALCDVQGNSSRRVLRCAVGNSSVLAARLTAPGSGDPGPAKARSVTREPQGARSREGAQRGPREPATRTPATNNKNGLARRAQRAPRQDERLGQG